MEISPDTVSAVCYDWGHITLQCPDMDKQQYQLYVIPHTAKNHR